MKKHEFRPGASTAYSAINQLLNVDERFLMNGQAFLLAPKTIPCLSALLFLLNKEQVTYSLMKEPVALSKDALFLSLKNLKRLRLLDEDKVEVEAGCKLEELQSFLFEQKSEIGLESISNPSRSIGELVLAGEPVGLKLHQLDLRDRLLAVELVKLDGGILKWDAFGPQLQQLIYGIKEIQALLVKLTFKISPIPPVRLYLSGSFEGWSAFDRLLSWTSSWERLDCLISAKKNEKGFILGQISGLREEMEAFERCCPKNLQVIKEDKVHLFKAYFLQQKAVYRLWREYPLKDFSGADYYWHQGLTHNGWLIYLEQPEEVFTEANTLPLWEKRLGRVLEISSNIQFKYR